MHLLTNLICCHVILESGPRSVAQKVDDLSLAFREAARRTELSRLYNMERLSQQANSKPLKVGDHVAVWIHDRTALDQKWLPGYVVTRVQGQHITCIGPRNHRWKGNREYVKSIPKDADWETLGVRQSAYAQRKRTSDTIQPPRNVQTNIQAHRIHVPVVPVPVQDAPLNDSTPSTDINQRGSEPTDMDISPENVEQPPQAVSTRNHSRSRSRSPVDRDHQDPDYLPSQTVRDIDIDTDKRVMRQTTKNAVNSDTDQPQTSGHMSRGRSRSPVSRNTPSQQQPQVSVNGNTNSKSKSRIRSRSPVSRNNSSPTNEHNIPQRRQSVSPHHRSRSPDLSRTPPRPTNSLPHTTDIVLPRRGRKRGRPPKAVNPAIPATPDTSTPSPPRKRQYNLRSRIVNDNLANLTHNFASLKLHHTEIHPEDLPMTFESPFHGILNVDFAMSYHTRRRGKVRERMCIPLSHDGSAFWVDHECLPNLYPEEFNKC